MGDIFSSYHPLISFTYFGLMIACSMVFMHPLALVLSLLGALSYSIYLNGRKAVRFNLVYLLPMLIVATLLNPAFNHQGGTIITYLRSGNPLTLESIIYGLCAGVMLVTVIGWFSCYNAVMTSDKFIYLFGRIIPSMSLILSMTLRFVPMFKDQLKIVSNAQKCVGRDVSQGSVLQRIKHGLTILSIMTTWALENAIETADSMKSRGYGLPGRTAFSNYRFDTRDKKMMAFLLVSGLYILSGGIQDALSWRFYPTIKGVEVGIYSISVFFMYFVVSILPIAINWVEDRKWKVLQSRN